MPRTVTLTVSELGTCLPVWVCVRLERDRLCDCARACVYVCVCVYVCMCMCGRGAYVRVSKGVGDHAYVCVSGRPRQPGLVIRERGRGGAIIAQSHSQ